MIIDNLSEAKHKVQANTLLHIDHVKKMYEDATEKNYVLQDISIDVEEEDFLCILGPSGCGKSTLIRCIAGFEKYEGNIEVAGKSVYKPGPDRTMIFQDFNQLFPWKTVLHNITYPLKVNGIKDKSEQVSIAMKYLEKVNLKEYKDYYPHQLSGGMKQRVAIARGMALKSRILLMDEPFASLDAITRNKLQTELLHIKEKENMTVLFITHNIQEAISLGNRILVMSSHGRIKYHMVNPIKKPVTPASEGYGELWEFLNKALTEESEEERVRKFEFEQQAK